jgi:hypothetical protein
MGLPSVLLEAMCLLDSHPSIHYHYHSFSTLSKQSILVSC